MYYQSFFSFLRNGSLALFLLLFLSRCNYFQLEVGELSEGKEYFDLTGFVDQQLALTDSLRPEVKIMAVVNGEEEQKTVRTDSSFWVKAFGFLKESDINLPKLQGRYEVVDSTSKEGDRIVSYQANNSDMNIQYLNITYQQLSNEVQQIETYFKDKNLLYTTERTIKVHFNNSNGAPQVNIYEVMGKQKMIMKDSITYHDKILAVYQ